MDMQQVEQVRRFNRTITERIGGKQGREVRELKRRLGLDSADVSRLLRSRVRIPSLPQ